MAWEEITAESDINQRLANAKTRNPDLDITDRTQMFRDPSLFLKDDTLGGIIVFSHRGSYWEGSFGSFAVDTSPSLDAITAFFQRGFNWAASNFPGLPFSAVYPETHCPWLREVTSGRTDFTSVDRVVQAVNSIQPRTMVRLLPPQDLSVRIERSGVYLGDVYLTKVHAHSVPFSVDSRWAR